MRKYSDNEIKLLFKTLKKNMFYTHPIEFETVIERFLIDKKIDFNVLYQEDEEEKISCRKLNEFILNFPMSIYIETINRCNLKCKMCPYASSSRSYEKMSDSLFKKIVDEIACKQPSITVAPFYLGEPLMDHDIFNKIAYCKKQGLTYTKLSTNGSLLSKNKNYKNIVDCGLDLLIISFDAITKEKYEYIRSGASFEKFNEGVSKLVDYKKQVRSDIKIVGQMINMEENSDEKKYFEDYLAKRGIKASFVPLQFWNKKTSLLNDLDSQFRYPCNNPFYSAVVLSNGDLVTCCMDYNGSHVFGNLNTDSLEDIWKYHHMKVREAHQNKEFEKFNVCKNCDDWITFGYNKFSSII